MAPEHWAEVLAVGIVPFNLLFACQWFVHKPVKEGKVPVTAIISTTDVFGNWKYFSMKIAALARMNVHSQRLNDHEVIEGVDEARINEPVLQLHEDGYVFFLCSRFFVCDRFSCQNSPNLS